MGTPQGGIISPTLANMTLDGLDATIDKAFGIKNQAGWLPKEQPVQNPPYTVCRRLCRNGIRQGHSGKQGQTTD